jgi:hypothetical protein
MIPKLNVLFVVSLAFLLRVLLFTICPETFDSMLWRMFGRSISDSGLSNSYRDVYMLNHPPAASFISGVLYSVSRGWGFNENYWCRFLSLLAEAGIVWLLYTYQKYTGKERIVIRYLLSSIPAIIVFGFGNIDVVCFFFVLWAIIELDKSKSYLKSGLLLGVSLNIKLLPLFLVPVLISIAGDFQRIRRFLIGLGISCSPFFFFFILDPHGLFRKVLNYVPELKFRWGMPVLLQGTGIEDWYYTSGKYISLFGVLLVCIFYKVYKKNDPFVLVLQCSLVFFLFAPAIFMYYLMYAHLFMLFSSPVIFMVTEFLLAPLLFCYTPAAMSLQGILSKDDVLLLTSILTSTLYSFWMLYLVYLFKRKCPKKN